MCLLKYNQHIITAIIISLLPFSIKAQSTFQKYNETLKITEYYNADSTMTSFSRYNKRFNTIDFYSTKGIKLRSEPAVSDSTNVIPQKKAYPKAQLTQKELEDVQEWRYQKIGAQNLIREEDPDLEHIGYYNLKGKLVAVKQYNRRTEAWEVKILSPDTKE